MTWARQNKSSCNNFFLTLTQWAVDNSILGEILYIFSSGKRMKEKEKLEELTAAAKLYIPSKVEKI